MIIFYFVMPPKQNKHWYIYCTPMPGMQPCSPGVATIYSIINPIQFILSESLVYTSRWSWSLSEKPTLALSLIKIFCPTITYLIILSLLFYVSQYVLWYQTQHTLWAFTIFTLLSSLSQVNVTCKYLLMENNNNNKQLMLMPDIFPLTEQN